LIVFDDCDAVFQDKESINILKAVLDTSKKREVSRILKTHFDSFDMTDAQIWKEYKERGHLPKQFDFVGSVIFISNVSSDSMDKAIYDRSLNVDVDLSKEEVIDRINSKMSVIMPNIDMNIKKSTLDYMLLLNDSYDFKVALSLRTFVHCLNIRLANSFKIGDIDAWMMLIKQFLVKKKSK